MSEIPELVAPSAGIAETELGPVQFATFGTGAPVLVVHGSPGGFDAAVAMASALPPTEFTAIVLSRPGYLGTELGDRRTIDQQADLFAALLDHLGISRAGVLTWSGGGPSGYRFTIRHPDRVTGLVALAAVSKSLVIPTGSLVDRLMFSTKAGSWLIRAMALHAPEKLISATLDAEGSLTKEELEQRTAEVFRDDRKRRFVLDLAPTATHDGPRRAGYDNDCAQFAAIQDLQLDRIRTRCLIVHGTADTDVTPDHSQHAAATIPGAELLLLDSGTHLAFFTHPDADAAQARAHDFLR